MARYLFVRLTCPHCKDWTLLIEEINSNLPPQGKVKVIDVTNSVHLEVIDDPIIEKIMDDDITTPTLYLGEIDKKIVGTSSREWVKGLLYKYFEDEFLT